METTLPSGAGRVPTADAGGRAMPLIGFGTHPMRGDQATEAVLTAFSVGYRLVDTATRYRNEAAVGAALAATDLPRSDLFVTTKMPPDQVGRERLTLERSLAALGCDYVDLWLIHWPPARHASPAVWQQFLAIRDKGLVREVGVSNYSTAQLDELIAATGEAPAVNQIKWGPSLFDGPRLAEHQKREIVLEGYSPFKTTNLSNPTLVKIADAHGVTADQVVLRWHLEHETVVIPKSVTPARIESNFTIFGFTLTADEIASIDALGS